MKLSIIVCAMALMAQTAVAREFNDWGGLNRYDQANKELMAQPNSGQRVVFLGNSITDNWPFIHADFFENNPDYIGRGIGGQTTYQFLVRFREDVINLEPAVLVLNGATNDVAENTNPYDEDRSFGNIVSMIELAQANGIKVILTSVLPAAGFNWNPEIKDAPAKIEALNARLREYAKANGIDYCDYYNALVTPDKALNADYSPDGVHPNEAGYMVMEAVVVPLIEKNLKSAKGKKKSKI